MAVNTVVCINKHAVALAWSQNVSDYADIT